MNLMEFFEEMNTWSDWNGGGGIDFGYMDFTKTFDMVPHGRQVQKINHLGRTSQWIQHRFDGRSQSVIVESNYSDWRPLKSSVLQGSELGPLLFIIYINNLDNNVINMGSKFTNGTNIESQVENEKGYFRLHQGPNQLGEIAG